VVVAILAVIDGKAQSVALGRIGERQVADLGRKLRGDALLEAERIQIGIGLHERLEFHAGAVFAEVVADDSNHVSVLSLLGMRHQPMLTTRHC